MPVPSGAPADLARAALGVHEAEIWIGRPTREAVALLEAALTIGRTGQIARIARACSAGSARRFTLWVIPTAQSPYWPRRLPLLGVVATARRCTALWCGRTPLLLVIPVPHRISRNVAGGSTRIAALAEEIGAHEYLAWGFGPAAAYLEMGDCAGFAASLTDFREYSSKHRISTFEWGLTSADTMRAILLGEFAEAERLADRALEIGELVHGELVTGVYGVQMFTIRREQGRLAEVAPLFRRFLDENPRDAAWRPGMAVIASDLGFDGSGT